VVTHPADPPPPPHTYTHTPRSVPADNWYTHTKCKFYKKTRETLRKAILVKSHTNDVGLNAQWFVQGGKNSPVVNVCFLLRLDAEGAIPKLVLITEKPAPLCVGWNAVSVCHPGCSGACLLPSRCSAHTFFLLVGMGSGAAERAMPMDAKATLAMLENKTASILRQLEP
jgi:hypothetical protein